MASIVPILALLLGVWGMLATGCSRCRGVETEAGWESLRAARLEEAETRFLHAVEQCPSDLGAQTGLGYVSLRRGDLYEAEERFEAVLARDQRAVDALVGQGIAYWRRGEAERAREAFRRTVEIDPDNSQAQTYLERFYDDSERPPRNPLVRPDTLVLRTRISGRRFEVHERGGWQDFYVKGVNLGVGIPGRHPTEFPDSATYALWFRLMRTMGANTVRTYTMHPPDFYEAFLDYNRVHPEHPLHLLQGVWAELPPDGVDFDHPRWRERFYREMRRVVDMVHGRVEVPVQPGHASGYYTADVSRWVLGYILGREWEAEAVAGYNELQPDQVAFSGRFVDLPEGTPTDVWMARAIDEMVAYETEKYNAQRPVAYTNWPPTDPLRHPTDPNVEEESAIRRAFGAVGDSVVGLAGADAVTLDPVLMEAREPFRAGLFASYHVYPYYPDFMVLEADLARGSSPWGPSNYWGYLNRLRDHHADMPVLIAEYGIPASIGVAHFQPQGWHHGGIDEARMAELVARMTREIEASGMAGGVVFSWIDEWFKKTWITEPQEVPQERDRLWYNRMDPEEHYGMLAAEARAPFPGSTLEERLEEWRTTEPLHSAPDGSTLRAAVDEAYVWLLVEHPGDRAEVRVGFDVLDPARGVFHWPDDGGAPVGIGLDFVMEAAEGRVRIRADSAFRPVHLDPLPFDPPGELEFRPEISEHPASFERGRFLQNRARDLWPADSGSGRWASLEVLTNRHRFGRDSTEYAAMAYDWGVLPEGPGPDGLWERAPGVLEVRIPWQLLNVADPSQRRVLAYEELPDAGELGTVRVEEIRLVYAVGGDDGHRTWPDVADGDAPASLTWPTWDTPRWTVRMRPAYRLLRDTWSGLGGSRIAGARR